MGSGSRLPARQPLQDMSWKNINIVSMAGKASEYWSIGDKKAIIVSGATYQAQIIAFGHDNLTGGGKAGITFQLENCLSTSYKMNSSDTNVGGWKSCLMRTSTMASLYNQLSADLKAVIKPVNKLTSKGNKSTTIETTSDKLFLLSQVEVVGNEINSVPGEGLQYAFYKAGNSVLKRIGTTVSVWWTRSPNKDYNDGFRAISHNGGTADGYSSSPNGVAFGFCV